MPISKLPRTPPHPPPFSSGAVLLESTAAVIQLPLELYFVRQFPQFSERSRRKHSRPETSDAGDFGHIDCLPELATLGSFNAGHNPSRRDNRRRASSCRLSRPRIGSDCFGLAMSLSYLGIKERQALRWFAVFHDHIPDQGTTLPRISRLVRSRCPRLDAAGNVANPMETVKK